MAERIGILGGSFDPVHRGHLELARAARRALALDRVLLVPARLQPLKTEGADAPAADRLAMLRLACEGEEGLEVSTSELDRAGRSYTVETLEELARAHPDAELVFLGGVDLLETLPGWHRIDDALALARFCFVRRPGFAGVRVPAALKGRVELVDLGELDLSSTGIRERLAAGEPVEGMLPERVLRYVKERGLYGVQTAAA